MEHGRFGRELKNDRDGESLVKERRYAGRKVGIRRSVCSRWNILYNQRSRELSFPSESFPLLDSRSHYTDLEPFQRSKFVIFRLKIEAKSVCKVCLDFSQIPPSAFRSDDTIFRFYARVDLSSRLGHVESTGPPHSFRTGWPKARAYFNWSSEAEIQRIIGL